LALDEERITKLVVVRLRAPELDVGAEVGRLHGSAGDWEGDGEGDGAIAGAPAGGEAPLDDPAAGELLVAVLAEAAGRVAVVADGVVLAGDRLLEVAR
jgi:hypothetical protein